MHSSFIIGLILLGVGTPALPKTLEVSLSEKVPFTSGDVIKLKSSTYTVEVGGPYERVKCAIPRQNCGAGYQPPRPTFQVKCPEDPCPFILQTFAQDGTSGTLSIETEESCAKKGHQASTCFYDYGRAQKSDEGCMKLKTALGKYYCLRVYSLVARPDTKNLCDELPSDVYALKTDCFYDYAILYKDPSFCGKFEKKDVELADRCWSRMAEVMRDKKLCQKISDTKTHSYKSQCENYTY